MVNGDVKLKAISTLRIHLDSGDTITHVLFLVIPISVRFMLNLKSSSQNGQLVGLVTHES